MNSHVQAQCRVWTVTETRHILRSDPPQDTVAVNIAAARNEWISFQILIRSDKPVNTTNVDISPLRSAAGDVIAASHSLLYRQHQLHLETGTYRNEGFKPDWYPDPLIPAKPLLPPKDTYPARFMAVPFDLPANETHGFWVDCFIPTDTPPGNYTGTYRLTWTDEQIFPIPIALTVWDFTLPQIPTLVTAFGSPAQRMRSYYRGKESEPSDWSYIEKQCALLLSQHRFNATPPSEMLRPQLEPNGSYEIPADQLRALQQFIDLYHINAVLIPHPSSVVKDPDKQADLLKAWLAAFDKAAAQIDRPHLVFYTYLKDEPNTEEDYRYVQKWGRAIRQANSVVKVMVVEQTWTEPGKGGADSAWGDLYGAVDIWCPLFSLHRPDSAARRRQFGETIWTYTALCQGQPTPWWHIDYPLLNYRVPGWMAWRDEIKGLLYWGGMSYWWQTEDPWTIAPFYTGSGKPQQGPKAVLFNGEGSLVYPARALGYDGIVPTIRLKALRDAIEDYEYLAILERMGRKEEALAVVRDLTQSWFDWNKNPAIYEAARAQLAAMITSTAKAESHVASATGPLRIHPTNPRYFTDGKKMPDGSLRAVYLTGAHTWNNLIDMGRSDPPEPFDFNTYLDFLQRHHHNFIRLWAWDSTRWDTRANGVLGKDFIHHVAPLPWARTGPGDTLDGKPKFDLTRFEPAYFERLRSRVEAASRRGIYVSIMFFEGWGLYHGNRRHGTEDGWAWRSHPFNPANNVNDVTFEGADAFSGRIHCLGNTQVNNLQAAYIRKVVDTVNDLDNVLYEVINEGGEQQWNRWVIATVHEYEKTKAKQHPVGNTGHGAERLPTMLASGADWVSPGRADGFAENPPAWNEKKPSLLDTDHIWGVGGNPAWVWKSFLRGHNPIFMDPYCGAVLGQDHGWESIRMALGYARRMAERRNLAAMRPLGGLASTTYCLADPGKEYIVYQPTGGAFTVELAPGTYLCEWFAPAQGAIVKGEQVLSSGGGKQFKPPFNGDAVLYLKANTK
ncbi:MAG: DUF4091 domain-containing protein [Sedimentisphaerales bacterium]|nr:DUF4091 domain-containing protein [Sedimentisphaerales bacterium]